MGGPDLLLSAGSLSGDVGRSSALGSRAGSIVSLSQGLLFAGHLGPTCQLEGFSSWPLCRLSLQGGHLAAPGTCRLGFFSGLQCPAPFCPGSLPGCCLGVVRCGHSLHAISQATSSVILFYLLTYVCTRDHKHTRTYA